MIEKIDLLSSAIDPITPELSDEPEWNDKIPSSLELTQAREGIKRPKVYSLIFLDYGFDV